MSTKSYTKTRFSANDSALVLIDHQSGIMQLVHDYSPAEFRNNVIALAKIGKVFNLPTVLTTSYSKGPTAPFPRETSRCPRMRVHVWRRVHILLRSSDLDRRYRICRVPARRRQWSRRNLLARIGLSAGSRQSRTFEVWLVSVTMT